MTSKSDTEKPDPYPTPKLPLFTSIPPPHHHSKPSGTSTPPFETTVSIPFHWEQQPGIPKPHSSTDHIIITHPSKCLHLPPRLLLSTTTTKTILSPSPTTVLHGPQRRRTQRRHSSFDSDGDGGQNRWLLGDCKVTSSSTSAMESGCGKGRKMKMKRKWNESGSRFWVKIYEGFKKVVPWRKKPKIECFSL